MASALARRAGAAGRAAFVLSALAAALAPSGLAAQTFPDRPIKIIVPVGPAGSYDLVGRLLADQLSRRLGQSVSVENRAGGGMNIGTQAVAIAPPDGTTLLIGGLANLVFNISYTLVGAKSLPYANVQEIIAAARKDTDALKVANVGIGSGQHIFGAAFQKLTRTKLLEVSYRGSAAAFPDVLTGRVDLFFDSTPAALPYVKSDQVKGLDVLAAKRNAQMPDVPTMTEAGVPGLEIDSWIGLFAPARTPPAIIARLRQEIAQSLPELKPRFEANGGELMEMPFDQLDAFVKSEHAKWIKVIQDAGISLD